MPEGFLEFAILITASPLSSGGDTAFQFIQTVLKKGHKIRQIFFYQDGVYHGSRLIHTENPELITRWQVLAREHALPLILCSASSARRGIMGIEQAKYFEKDTNNLAKGFCIAGLSVWFEAMNLADRVMTFGDVL